MPSHSLIDKSLGILPDSIRAENALVVASAILARMERSAIRRSAVLYGSSPSSSVKADDPVTTSFSIKASGRWLLDRPLSRSTAPGATQNNLKLNELGLERYRRTRSAARLSKKSSMARCPHVGGTGADRNARCAPCAAMLANERGTFLHANLSAECVLRGAPFKAPDFTASFGSGGSGPILGCAHPSRRTCRKSRGPSSSTTALSTRPWLRLIRRRKPS